MYAKQKRHTAAMIMSRVSVLRDAIIAIYMLCWRLEASCWSRRRWRVATTKPKRTNSRVSGNLNPGTTST